MLKIKSIKIQYKAHSKVMSVNEGFRIVSDPRLLRYAQKKIVKNKFKKLRLVLNL